MYLETNEKNAEDKVLRVSGSSEVEAHVNRDKGSVRELGIKLVGFKRPEFTFKGPWAGKDVRTVVANIHRAYRMYTRELRRGNQANKPNKEDDDAEVQD